MRSRSEPVVEPGRPRRDLAIEVDIRQVGENKRRPGIIGATEPTRLDDAASGRGVGKDLDPAQAHVVRATVGAIDHRVGFASARYAARCRSLICRENFEESVAGFDRTSEACVRTNRSLIALSLARSAYSSAILIAWRQNPHKPPSHKRS
jgi:hypothetical protein